MTSGGVAVPKIGEEGEKKKAKKKFLCGSPKRGVGRKGKEGTRGPWLRACGGPDLCLECSNHSRPCLGPPGSPRSSQSPPESPREERFPEAPWGRHRPTEQVSVPLSLPGVAEEPLAARLHLFPPACPLPAASSPSQRPFLPLLQPSLTPVGSQMPRVREGLGEAPREGQPPRGTLLRPHLSSLPFLALQPHPRVNFCPLPPEQCYQPPGVPDDRGPTWVGSHGAPQRLQVSAGGEGRCGSPRRGEGEGSPGVVLCMYSPCSGSVSRGSRQTGASSALEAWMLR